MMLDDRAPPAKPSQIIADLRRERDEALAREAAIAEVLRVINSSPGDLAPVYQAMLEKALRLCEATHGTLRTFDGEAFHLAASAQREALALPGAGGGPNSLFARFMDGEQIVHLADVLDSPEYQSNPTVRQGMDAARVRSWLGVSLRKGERLLGVISVARQEVRPFSDEQIALLQNFALQAGIAMENAQLLTETREALEQQTATSEVLGIINSSPGQLSPVFDAILEKAHTLCGAASGGLMLIEGNRYRAVAVHGDPSLAKYWLDLGWIPFPTGDDTLFGRLSRGELFHLCDATVDDGTRKSEQYHRLVELAGARSLVMVPLRKDEVLVGTITAFRKEVQPFSEKQIVLLQNFAAQAVIAMENARLITETREALEQQTATAEVLQVINSSPGDLVPVFDAMLEKALRLCDASFGSVYTRNGERFERVVSRGVPAEYLAAVPSVAGPFSPGGLFERIIGGESLISIPDLAEPEVIRLTPRFEPLVRIAGARSYVAVALRKDEQLLGLIAIYRREVRPFSDKQISLLQDFAAQAVIAMENARLMTETREALERQTATAEVLQVINSSPGNLAPVFDAMLEKAMHLCEAAFGMMVGYDGEQFPTIAIRDLPPAAADFLQKPLAAEANLAELVRGENVIHIPDARETEAYRLSVPGRAALVDLAGARTALWVALRKEQALLGAFIIYRQEVRPFSDKQISLLQNFAAQAVIAMESARLLGELRDRTGDLEEALGYQTATSDVLKVISRSAFDLRPVLTTLVETAARLCEADRGLITTQDGEVYRVVATFAVTPEFDAYLRSLSIVPNRETVTGRIVLERQVVHIDDLARDPEYALPVSGFIEGAHTMLGVPLMREGQPIGAIVLARHRVEPFTPRQIELVRTFSDQAVIAMENARLLGELHQRTDEIASWNRELEARVAAQVEELGRAQRLKRFLAPQLAEMIVSQGDEKILESHRREIVVVFCDLRGYTAFTETAEPEEVLDFLREYHGALGPLVSQFEGTLDQFSGDGIMVFFNDPVPCPDPAERAVKMAIAMREAAGTLTTAWRRRGRVLGFGAGIAQGYATLGQIGFADRSGYTAIGTVCNLAARLCAEAKDGQILVAQRVAVAVEETTPLEELGELALKGLTQPVVAFNVPASVAGATAASPAGSAQQRS